MKTRIQKTNNIVSRNLKICAIALVAAVSFSSCNNDDDQLTPVNEEEVTDRKSVV